MFLFKKLEISGLIIIESQKFSDERGFFMEIYKKSEFVQNGITEDFVQDNYSMSCKGTLRGLHYQLNPKAQGKLVKVLSGRVWDVAVDLRRDSKTFGKWIGVELSGEDNKLFYIPAGFAHGFLALEDNTKFLYKCTAEYDKNLERSIRYNDPELNIDWPIKDNLLLTTKDITAPFFKKMEFFI